MAGVKCYWSVLLYPGGGSVVVVVVVEQWLESSAIGLYYSIPAAASWWWWWLSSGWSEVLVVCRLDDVVSVTPAVLTRVESVGHASQWVTLSGSQCSLVVSRLNAAASGFFVSSLMSSTDRQ